MPSPSYPSAEYARNVEPITIYYDKNYFAAWPFNHGFTAFSDSELLISFSRGPCAYTSPYDMAHHVVDARGCEYVVMRSTDGGMTWPLDQLGSLGTRQAIERPLYMNAQDAPSEPYDWSSPDFFMTAGFGIPPARNQDIGYIQYSRDRGHNWEGPYRMPSFGFAWCKSNRITSCDRMVWCCSLSRSASPVPRAAVVLWRFTRRRTRADLELSGSDPGRFGRRSLRQSLLRQPGSAR